MCKCKQYSLFVGTFVGKQTTYNLMFLVCFGLWCLTPLSTILATSWWSVLLVEETGETTDLSQVTEICLSQKVIMLYRVHLAMN
jgi:hypothetical protein